MGEILTAGGSYDPRPEGRISNPKLLKFLHLLWKECAICHAIEPLSLHHIVKHPRNDVEENLVMLCGDGVRGCHGKIEANDEETKRALGQYIQNERPDTIMYLFEKKGVEAREWMRWHLLLE